MGEPRRRRIFESEMRFSNLMYWRSRRQRTIAGTLARMVMACILPAWLGVEGMRRGEDQAFASAPDAKIVMDHERTICGRTRADGGEI